MRASARYRDSIRRATAWIALVSIAALLLLPAVAFAESLLVSKYKVSSEAAAGDDHSDAWYVIDENALKEPIFSARSLRGADGSNGLDWSAVGEVDARVVGRGYSADTYYTPFTSFEDFAARSVEMSPGEDYLFRASENPSLRVWGGALKTTLGGLDAYVNRSTVRLEYTDGADAEYGNTWVYWIPAGSDSGILITAASAVTWSEDPGRTSGEHYGAQLDPMTAEVESVLASLRFHALDGTSAGADVPGSDGGDTSPWRTITGGLAAVAAAAIGLAGAAASARTKTPDAEEPAPDQPVGYVLQLSTGRLTVSAEHSASFTAQAFKVLPNGSFQPAADAAIVLHLPAGVSVQPQTAYGTLQTTVWQTGEVATGAAITVEASASLGSTTASVPVTAAGGSRIVTRFEPAGMSLRTQGDDSLTLVAVVELLGTDLEADTMAVRASLEFAKDSEWIDISRPADYEDGRAVTVVASQPDPTSLVQPPDSATVRVSAQIGEHVLSELVAIPLARLPEIDARPDHVTFAADSGVSAEVSVWIDNAGGTAWSFETNWREGARLLATPDIVSTGPATATLTLTEDAGDRIDPSRPQSSATLVVVASADGFEPICREVQVIITQEGLFIDRANIDPSAGAFTVRADGSAVPVDIDLRVFVRDEASGEITPNISLAQATVLEIGGEEGTSGHAGLSAGGLTVQAAGVRPLSIPSATFRIALERELPTGGELLAASLRASVPGRDDERFSAMVPLRLLGVNTDPFSDAWQAELDGCRKVIGTFVPAEHRERLYALVNERSLTMGAEGLFKMRTGLWSFAYDQMMIEKHEHLDAAWWNEQIEGTLDWISWCGDIALGVASGAYLGVVGSVAIGMLKPLLVSAMETWQRGGSLEDWLSAQASMLTGVVEGSLTDPDFLTKLSGDKKAIGWALFIAYYFAKELYNDPQLSVTGAMKRVGAQLRDEGLIRFLQKIAGMKGGAGADAGKPKAGADGAKAKAAEPDAAQPKPGADADTPASKAKKPPKGSPAKRAASMAADLTAKTADGGKVDRATVERILRDPDAMRELKKSHPDLWKKMHETRAEIYEGHDRKLEQWVAENLPEAEGRKIEVESFGTPDGVDRDYRVGYVTTDPVTGQRRFIELKKESWAAESQRIFAKETGGPSDPKGAAKWAKDHQQLATDQHHAEASVDMADQGTIYNEKTGKWEKSQITPNIDMVKAGKSTLLDPDGLGKTYETKVAEAYHEGNKLDAYKQADKAVHSLEGVGDGYAKQGYGVKDPLPKVKAGMDVIKDVQSGKLTPEAADARLKELEYSGGLPDFMEKVSGQFASFKWARKV
ncbi:MAG: hypothetical protein Q7U89_03150 [Coriobacteriia bacterium]|nr:hypothetical protein [Coriobacteriia bacterium]